MGQRAEAALLECLRLGLKLLPPDVNEPGPAFAVRGKSIRVPGCWRSRALVSRRATTSGGNTGGSAGAAATTLRAAGILFSAATFLNQINNSAVDLQSSSL
jgi:hypothetical protein